MYQVSDYLGMISDRVRMEPYIQALRQTVNNTSVVIDIGTGIGIFAILAARLGARKVYAIEPNPAIQLARDLANDNGCSERIEFIEGLSTDVTLPERADVIVSDLRGVLPLSSNHLTAVIDARKRFLKPGGTLIPRADTLFVSVVESPESYKAHAIESETDYLSLNLNAARKFTVNTWRRRGVSPDQMITETGQWARIDYREVSSPDVSGELSLTCRRDGTAHGFVVWFDTELTGEIGFSNAPGGGAKVYGSAFFPWSDPVSVMTGDRIMILLEAKFIDDDYTWTWETTVFDSNQPDHPKARFKQSTFFAQALTPLALQKYSADFVPSQTEDNCIDKFILEHIDSSHTQGQIASSLLSKFPGHFRNWHDALTRVGQVSSKYAVNLKAW